MKQPKCEFCDYYNVYETAQNGPPKFSRLRRALPPAADLRRAYRTPSRTRMLSAVSPPCRPIGPTYHNHDQGPPRSRSFCVGTGCHAVTISA